MTISPPLLLLISLAIWQSYWLSRQLSDPDFALFNQTTFTGAWYGKDYADCKTPGIHLYYWLIGLVAGASVPIVKFIDHMLTALPGLIYYQISGNFAGALIYIGLVNSPHLQAFTGNVGHLATALIMASMISIHPGVSCLFLCAAVFVEPKYLPAAIAAAIIQGWWQAIPVLFSGMVAAAGILWLIARFNDFDLKTLLGWIIESSVTIPGRMSKYRHKLVQWMPWWTSEPLMIMLPWIVAAAITRPEMNFWLPAILYVAVISLGFTIRPYHLIPLVPFIALAGIPQDLALILWAIEFLTAGFYLGNMGARHYRYYWDQVLVSSEIGKWMKDKEGSLWVNGMHTEVYLYAQKKCPFDLIEQIEINDVAHERRAVMKEEWIRHPPDWVVVGDNAKVKFQPNGYTIEAEAPGAVVYRKVV
jgi:hypothetical protein